MGPVTTAGAIAQAHAETLVGVALGQLTRPGSPVIYGNFLSSMALRSRQHRPSARRSRRIGSLVVGQLARRVGLPLRCSGAFTVVQGPRRPGDAGVGGVDAGGHPLRRQLHPPLGRLAGGRAGHGLREVHHGRRPLRRAAHVPEGHRSVGGAVRHGRLPGGRARQALLRRPAHASPLRDRVLGQLDGRQRPATSSGATAASAGSRSGPPTRWPSCWPPTSHPPSTPPSTRSCATSWIAGRPSSPTPGTDPPPHLGGIRIRAASVSPREKIAAQMVQPRAASPPTLPYARSMAGAFPHVFEPLTLRHVTLRNRIVFGAHTANMAEQGLPGARHLGVLPRAGAGRGGDDRRRAGARASRPRC